MGKKNSGYFLKANINDSRIEFEYQLMEIAQGLTYLHGKGIVHGDLRGVSARLATFVIIIEYSSFQAQHIGRLRPGSASCRFRDVKVCRKRRTTWFTSQ